MVQITVFEMLRYLVRKSIRMGKAWGVLGNLTIVGMIVFVIGRMVART